MRLQVEMTTNQVLPCLSSGYGNWHHTQPGLSEVATDGNNGNGNGNGNGNLGLRGAAIEPNANITWLWAQLGQPLLFSVVGSTVDLRWVDATTAPRALLVILAGVSVRLVVAVLVTGGGDFSPGERCLMAAAWGSKATVQAALCTIPLAMVKGTFDKEVG